MRTVSVFALSLLVCLVMLGLERAIGIRWDYHPDAVTYVTDYAAVVQGGWLTLPNNLYYFVAYAVGGSAAALIAINMIVYSLTNVLIANSFHQYARVTRIRGLRYLVLLVVLLFAPYRLHLAVHGLKDTLIISSLFVIASASYASWIGWIPMLLLRIYAVLYSLLFLPRRKMLLALILGIAILLLLGLQKDVTEFLLTRSEVAMGGRAFDQVPSFAALGITGAILRAVLWPLLALSGGFLLVSPSFAYAPIALDLIVSRLWCRNAVHTLGVTAGVLACLSIIALSVNSFTAYIRYCYPVIAAIPLMLMRQRLALQASVNGPISRRAKGPTLEQRRDMADGGARLA